MKAFLLAAGHGTRLRPLTNTKPKCLVEVNSKPLIEYWFDLFRKYNVTDILINLNHFPDQVYDYIERYANDLKITLSIEEKLLGSLGTLLANSDFYKDENEFLLFYSDNLTNINISTLLNYHQSHNLPFTMGLFRAKDPKSCGIAELDYKNTIIDFLEKPKHPASNLANAGIYVIKPSVLANIESINGKLLDIGFDLLPRLTGRMKGFEIEDYLLDVGTHQNLKIADEFVKSHQELFIY